MSPGGKMKTRPFIGKTVSLEKLRMAQAEICPCGKYDDEFTVAEVFLSDFECCITDRTGRNAYSIQLYLDEQDRIIRIQRVGHCHMCGGQGSDDELKRFPHRTLEEEAYQVLTDLLSNVL
jgi:hypothetical protein